MGEIDKEPFKENELWCAYCGPGWKADWELVTDEGEIVVCDNHHFVLKETNAIGLERKIGDEEWKKVPDFGKKDFNDDLLEDLGDWKDLIDYKAYKKDKKG
jgi:hypothetical protein